LTSTHLAAEFRAMGTDCVIRVDAPATQVGALLDCAVQRVGMLEACWSRFRPDSALSRLNAAGGRGPQRAGEDLRHLVTRMADAWQRTDGRYDPTVLPALRAAGYDRDFPLVTARPRPASAASPSNRAAPSPGMAGVRVDDDTITLPAGVELDPGGIGKGLAADIIVDELRTAGATGVLVNLGGDVVVAGQPHDADAWHIAIADERARPAHSPGAAAPPVELPALHEVSWPGPITPRAVVTSTSLRRRWGAAHHLIDPATGGNRQDAPLVQASVWGVAGWWADAAATSVMHCDPAAARAWLSGRGLPGLLVTQSEVIRVEPPGCDWD